MMMMMMYSILLFHDFCVYPHVLTLSLHVFHHATALTPFFPLNYGLIHRLQIPHMRLCKNVNFMIVEGLLYVQVFECYFQDNHLSVKYMSMHIWDVCLLKLYVYNYTFFVSWLGGWLRWGIRNWNQIFKILYLCAKVWKFMKKIWFLTSKFHSFSSFGFSGRDYIFPLQ
jgi:hypothetical protein